MVLTHLFNTFVLIQVISFEWKRQEVVLLKYMSVLNLYQKRSIKDLIVGMHRISIYQANQLEIKLNKNSTQASYFGLKF